MGTPAYAAIHRCILTGLLGNIATRTDEGDYHAAHDRRVNVFPGSTLFEKREAKKSPPGGRAPPAKAKIARWLMAAEIMETARLYARTCARIDPQWVLDLGGHLLRVAHSEPFWNADQGRVLVKERRRLYNLELETRSVGYVKINPVHATEIFIREGLVGDTVTWPFDFLQHNRRVRAEAETLLTRLRSAGYIDLDEATYRFYAAHLMPQVEPDLRAGSGNAGRKPSVPGGQVAPAGIGSVAELVDFVRHAQMTKPKFLFLAEDDLKPADQAEPDTQAFPDALPVDNRVLPLAYAYQPGQAADGVTVRVTQAEAEALTHAALDWAVPGHLVDKVELMLKALPKEQRRNLIPLRETAEKLAGELPLLAARPKQPTLGEALAELLQPRLGVRIDPALWSTKALPDHLRVRVEVVDTRGTVLCASRDLDEIKQLLHGRQREVSQQAASKENAAWRAARAQWEGEPAAEWKFGDLPASVTVEEKHGLPVLAHPGLKALPAGVAVRLFATPEQAAAATRAGLEQLFATQLRHDLGWLEKDLKALRMIGPLAVTLVSIDRLQADALQNIRRWVCQRALPALRAEAFAAELARAKQDLRGLVPKLGDWLKEILTLRLELETHAQPYPGLAQDLAALLPPDFLQRTPFERIKHLPRYLRGLKARADRWKRDAAKDSQRAAEIAPFVAAVKKGGAQASELRWLVEEFRISLFAQELGTAEPVSAVRLKRALEELPGAKPAGAPAAAPAIVPTTLKKGAPLKSLGALDQLFRK